MAHRPTLNNEEDVYRELGRRLGGEPNDTVWRLLVADRWPQDVAKEPASFGGLVTKYHKVLGILRKPAGDAKLHPAPPRERAETGPWSEACSQIMALQAAEEPYVCAFRKLVLEDTLVSPEKAQAWMSTRDEQSQEFELVVRKDQPGAMLGPRTNRWESQLAVEDYVNGKGREWPTRADFELDFLHCLGDVLQGWYGWAQGNSVAHFILSGAPPQLNAIEISTRHRERFFPGSAAMILIVSPRCSPRRVMELYSKVRKENPAFNQRVRQPNAHDLELAVFVARHNDGRTWAEAWNAWRGQHQDLKIADVRSFARDARRAYRQTTGCSLEWKSAKQTTGRIA